MNDTIHTKDGAAVTLEAWNAEDGSAFLCIDSRFGQASVVLSAQELASLAFMAWCIQQKQTEAA